MQQKKFVALLRGVNVSGKNSLKMDALRELCDDIGLQAVQTYLQSGNIVFASGKAAGLDRKIETAIFKRFKISAPVLVLSSAEVKKAAQENPFLKRKDVDKTRLYVTFLKEPPTSASLEKLEKIQVGEDEFTVIQNRVYLHCPKSYGKSKLSNTVFERLLSVTATTRNWNTVTALLEMSR